MNRKIIYTIFFILLTINLFAQETKIDWIGDTTQLKLKKYKIENNFDIKKIKPDTIIEHIEISHPNLRDYTFPIYFGHFVSPSISALFIEQDNKFEFTPIEYFQNIIFTEKNAFFFDANLPYSYFYYTGSDKNTDEQILDFLFTANIKKTANLGIVYKMMTSKDPLISQNSTTNNLMFWFYKRIKRYSFHASVFTNKIKLFENGGYVDTGDFEILTAQFYLNSATTYLSYKGFSLRQNYRIQDNIQLVNHIFYKRNYKLFLEKNTDTKFFENNFISTQSTYDSISFTQANNSIGIKINSLEVGIKNEMEGYYYFEDYLLAQKQKKYFNNSLYFRHYFEKNKIQIQTKANYFISGRKKNNYLIHSSQIYEFKNFTFSLNELVENKAPDLFLQDYNGNHFRWHNNFENIFRTQINFEISNNKHHLKTITNYTAVKNLIIFDTLAMPKQISDFTQVFTVGFEKKFKIKPFSLDLKFYYQNIDNQNITLPNFITFASFYTDFYYKKALRLNIGLNTYLSSEYYLLGYQPATGVFFYEKQKISNIFPITDLFISGNIQRAQFFLKLKNISVIFINNFYDQNYYSYVNHYHLPQFLFLIGVKWWFKN